MKCDLCLKEKEPYYKGIDLCQECADKMDKYLEQESVLE